MLCGCYTGDTPTNQGKTMIVWTVLAIVALMVIAFAIVSLDEEL